MERYREWEEKERGFLKEQKKYCFLHRKSALGSGSVSTITPLTFIPLVSARANTCKLTDARLAHEPSHLLNSDTPLSATFFLVALRALFDALQAKVTASTRVRKNTPALVTKDGDVTIIVEDGKRVGYKVR